MTKLVSEMSKEEHNRIKSYNRQYRKQRRKRMRELKPVKWTKKDQALWESYARAFPPPSQPLTGNE